MIVVCVRCGKYTTPLEANSRTFNQGKCGHCSGDLTPIQPPNLKEVKS